MNKQLTINDYAELQIFRGVNHSILKKIITDCSVLSVPKGTFILNNQQQNQCLYVLLEGTLDAYVSFQNEPISRMFAGQIFGEISLLDKKPISASVKAFENAWVLQIKESMFWYLIENSHDFSKNMIALLATRLRSFSDQVSNAENNKKNTLANYLDPLTGLYNREWFDSRFPIEVENAQIQNTSLIVLMLEIKANDKKVETALHDLSKNLQLRFRGFQHLSRYDDSQLIAIISRSDQQEVKAICKQCCEEINDDNYKLHFSFSQLTPIDTAESLIEKNLNMLAKSKTKNSNQVLDWSAFS